MQSFTRGIPAAQWDRAALPVRLVVSLPFGPFADEVALAEIEIAARSWSEVRCTSFRATVSGQRGAAAKDDSNSTVFFHTDGWPSELQPGALAQTVLHVGPGGALRDADIHVNGHDHRFSADGRPGAIDLRAVLTHEIGHVLGLGHSSDRTATMFATSSGLRWRSLEKDDQDGVCALYPGVGSALCPAAPCPSGQLCIAARCQRPGTPTDVCAPCSRVPDACEAAGDDARCLDLATGGRVCGRACASDEACGAGARCLPTTQAGDLQCVLDDACQSAGARCSTDADCMGFVCRGGICVGPAEPAADAGPGVDSGPRASPPDPPGGCNTGRGESRSAAVALLGLTLLIARRRRDR